MSRSGVAGLITCGAALVALTLAGLRFQADDDLHGFLVVAALQAALYAAAVWLVWRAGSGRGIVLGIAAVAMAMRVPVVLAPPYLSTDIYRYVWDGWVDAAGFNPYTHAPMDPLLEALRDSTIFPQIGSPYAPTIYPPIAEAIFFLVTRVSGSVAAMKAAMVGFEIVTFALLARLLSAEGLPTSRVLAYAWHPLPLWEFGGSGHVDAVLITCCLAALWAARQRPGGSTGLFLAGATLTKLYPVVLLPAFYRRWDWKLPAVFTAALVIAYLPFISAGAQIFGFLPGYAGQEGFDANGGGFYLLALLHRVPWFAALDARAYVLAGLAVLAAVSAVLVFHREPLRPSYAQAASLAALFTVLVSPHYPWYFSWLIVFIPFARTFALLWLTNSCLLLYLAQGYAFVQSGQRLAIESALYGPFAALALFDFCYNRRSAGVRN